MWVQNGVLPCALISRVGLEPGTDYQATRKVLLNQMLKPFAIPPFNIIQQPFYSIQQNRTDVEANVEAISSGLYQRNEQITVYIL